jgi:hypothetical protein
VEGLWNSILIPRRIPSHKGKMSLQLFATAQTPFRKSRIVDIAIGANIATTIMPFIRACHISLWQFTILEKFYVDRCDRHWNAWSMSMT